VKLDAAQHAVRHELHVTLKKALYDYERQQFNTVISACMTMVNALNRLGDSGGDRRVLGEGLSLVLRLLSPIAPHVAHHLWRALGYGDDITQATWPRVDPAALRQDEIAYVVQVNGKVRGKVMVSSDTAQAGIEAAALADANVQRFIQDKQVSKIIVVPQKLVNIVAQ
jgi:leucyl-tRNA synthetase